VADGGTVAVLGPVQVLLIGIDERGSDQMLAAELQDLRNQDAVKVLDLLRVLREPDGEVRRLEPLGGAGLPGTLVEALLITEADEHEGPESPDSTGAAAEDDVWFLADRVPRGAAVAILLIEHRWAIPLREAAAEAEAEVLGDAWLHPRDLQAARRRVDSPLDG
jgi:hypothetical protein